MITNKDILKTYSDVISKGNNVGTLNRYVFVMKKDFKNLNNFIPDYQPRMMTAFDKLKLEDKKDSAIYKPTRQVAAFEDMTFDPLDFSSNQFIDTIRKIIAFYFPGNTVTEDDEFITLTLDGETYRRSFYVAREAGVFTWRNIYFSKLQPEILHIIDNIYNSSLGYNRYSFISNDGELEKEITFEDSSLKNFRTKVFRFKKNLDLMKRLDYDTFKQIIKLVEYAHAVNFLSDVCAAVSVEIREVYNQKQEERQKEYALAQDTFIDVMKTKMVPVEAINHKTSESFLSSNKIESLLYPLTTNEDFLPKGTPVYTYVTNSGEWLILSPTEKPLEKYNFSGIYYYHGISGKQHFVTQEQDASQVVPKYPVDINIDEFNEHMASLFAYKEENELMNGILHTKTALAQFPLLFAKTPLPENKSLILTKEKVEIKPKEEKQVEKEPIMVTDESGEEREIKLNDMIHVSGQDMPARVKIISPEHLIVNTFKVPSSDEDDIVTNQLLIKREDILGLATKTEIKESLLMKKGFLQKDNELFHHLMKKMTSSENKEIILARHSESLQNLNLSIHYDNFYEKLYAFNEGECISEYSILEGQTLEEAAKEFVSNNINNDLLAEGLSMIIIRDFDFSLKISFLHQNDTQNNDDYEEEYEEEYEEDEYDDIEDIDEDIRRIFF